MLPRGGEDVETKQFWMEGLCKRSCPVLSPPAIAQTSLRLAVLRLLVRYRTNRLNVLDQREKEPHAYAFFPRIRSQYKHLYIPL